MYGEWVYAKHTVFYDQLPHYFLEFDILDKERGRFLDTESRAALLAGLPIQSVPVLAKGKLASLPALPSLVGPSLYKSSHWKMHLEKAALVAGISPERASRETDHSDNCEGLYIKVEANGQVVSRHKWVRSSFLTSVQDSGSHWLKRPILVNRLSPQVDIFAP